MPGSVSRAASSSTARTGASTGTPRSRPAASWSARRSRSSSRSRRSRPPETRSAQRSPSVTMTDGLRCPCPQGQVRLPLRLHQTPDQHCAPSTDFDHQDLGGTMAGEPDLAVGDSGEWVGYLQQLLEHNGFPVAADGEFGDATRYQLEQLLE